jgi:hypothetical protein
MRTDHVTGFLLILIAAVMNGAYAIPMKFMSRWKWENIWLAWTVLSLWALPLALGWAAVPHPIQAYSTTPWTSLAVMAMMGVLWGAGVLFSWRVEFLERFTACPFLCRTAPLASIDKSEPAAIGC